MTAKSSEKHLILVATTTPEKIERYQSAADQMGLPLLFRNVKELSVFHSAEEDSQTRIGNAGQKIDEIMPIYNACLEKDSAAQHSLIAYARHLGVKTEPLDHIHMAADDATFTVPQRLWKELRPRLAPYVPEALLDSAEKVQNQSDPEAKTGPGAETGPILAAVGVRNFMNLMREASLAAGYTDKKPARITNNTSLIVKSLGSGKEKDFEGNVSGLKLFMPEGHKAEFTTPPITFKDSRSWYVTTGDFVEHPRLPGRRVNGNLKYNSEGRWQIVDQLGDHFNLARSPAAHAKARRAMPEAGKDDAVFDTLHADLLEKQGVAMLSFEPHGHRKKPRDAYGLLKPIEAQIAGHDALLFTPLVRHEDETQKEFETKQLTAYLYLHSAIVARQLDPRDMNKPIVIMNLKNHETGKGHWEPAIESILDQARKGMFKDYSPGLYGREPLTFEGDVKHQMSSFFDVVTGTDAKALNKAAMKVMDARREHYHPSTALPTHREKHIDPGKAPPKKMYKVAVWTSATSDNRQLLEDLKDLGNHLANNEFGLIWGAGDRHAMGAVYDGYHQAQELLRSVHSKKKTWLAAFSTSIILRSETKHGRIPEGTDYREENANIYERMAHMIHKDARIHSDAFVVAPGGPGTSQEWLSALLVKRQLPKVMEGKPIIIYAPDLIERGKVANSHGDTKLFWERSARAFLGDEYWNGLKHDALAHGGLGKAEDGVYLTTNIDRLKGLLDDLQNKRKPGSPPPGTPNWGGTIRGENEPSLALRGR